MSEADAIALCTDGPVTRALLIRDLRAIGVRPGSVLMVHASLSKIGWMPGGARTLADALLDVLGPEGTLAVPTFSSDNSDPALWQNPPVPAEWIETIRAELPAYDPRLTSLREMSKFSDLVLRLPGVVRSPHPAQSWAAVGRRAEELCGRHDLSESYGPDSPCSAALRLGADVLSLGCVRTTILHFAEAQVDYPGRKLYTEASAMLVDGARQWVEYSSMEGDADFEQLRKDYIAAGRPCSCGTVGYGMARLFPARELVEFARDWLARLNQQSSE